MDIERGRILRVESTTNVLEEGMERSLHGYQFDVEQYTQSLNAPKASPSCKEVQQFNKLPFQR